ncbi:MULTISPECIES: hypothetical protein [unclassified Streptomyces]|uniref:hypothetical protein n=1 Tax=Streptomyces sp. NBC_00006 TaxID=2975619 RepID=UPI002B1DC21E|nr:MULTISPECIES: hypothetical protein [unclassified Streptomyces]
MSTERVERVDDNDEVVAVVSRADAISHNWLHRIATIVCRDPEGRTLVHRRPDDDSRFPGQYNWMLGGAVEVSESNSSPTLAISADSWTAFVNFAAKSALQ